MKITFKTSDIIKMYRVYGNRNTLDNSPADLLWSDIAYIGEKISYKKRENAFICKRCVCLLSSQEKHIIHCIECSKVLYNFPKILHIDIHDNALKAIFVPYKQYYL